MKRFLQLFVICITILFSSSIGCETMSLSQEKADITLDPAKTYQTITGWEAHAYAADWPGHSAAYPSYMKDLLDMAVDDLGLNRVRLEIGSGTENPVDYGQQFLNGQIDEREFIHNPGYVYQIINDNNDPFSINWNGFQFGWLDHVVDDIVNPLKQRLEARGEKLFINLNYVDFAGSSFEHYAEKEEYAEFILATYLHLQSRYGWVPDAVEVILEPDVASGWSGTQIGEAIAAAGNRLQANGFDPKFIAPSNTSMGAAVSYFDQLIQVPGVTAYLSELSYHRYSGVSDANLQAIANRGIQYGINTAMLEHFGTPYQNLHADLKTGRNSAWSGAYAIAGKNPIVDLYRIDDSDPNNPLIIMNDHTKFYRQYMKFIRSGAVRIEAATDNNDFDPLAFINNDGNYVVVVKANVGGAISIDDLPPATYGIKYTTDSEYDVDLTDITISTGQTLNTNIPAKGIITVYSKNSVTPGSPQGVNISGPTIGAKNALLSFTATITPATASFPITYAWNVTGLPPKSHTTNSLSHTTSFSWSSTGSQTITVTASNAYGSVVESQQLLIFDNLKHVYLPAILKD